MNPMRGAAAGWVNYPAGDTQPCADQSLEVAAHGVASRVTGRAPAGGNGKGARKLDESGRLHGLDEPLNGPGPELGCEMKQARERVRGENRREAENA